MNNVMKKVPGQAPAAFNGIVDQIFHNNLSRLMDDSFWGFNGNVSRNGIPVNIRETDKTYELELAAPGLKKEDFKVAVNGDTLTVSMEHKEESKEQKEGTLLRHEFRVQSFTRSFMIDDTVEPNSINARYTDGILYLTLPKKETAQKVNRVIEIE